MSLPSGLYTIYSAGATLPNNVNYTMYVSADNSVMGMTNSPGIWDFQQSDGLWSIQDQNTHLFFGYNQTYNSAPILAVRTEILWKITLSDSTTNGPGYTLTVPNSPVGSVLAANMDPAPQENNLFLLDAPPSQFTNELQIWNFVAV